VATGERVIKLVSRPGRREVFQSVEGEVSVGDRSVFTHDLYRDGQKVGFDGGVCTVVRADDDGARYILCNVDVQLPDGTIAFQTFMEELFPPPPFFTAITGGTGAYRSARGEMHIDPASPDTHYYTLYLDAAD
jgi:hypothetical protein